MKTIAWDVDDVLNDLMKMWFSQKWLSDHKECRLMFNELTENPPHRLLGASINDYLESLDEFRLSGLYQQMEPVNEVKEWFFEYGDQFQHVALTAVPLIAAAASSHWVIKNYGVWIRTFHFIPSKRDGQSIPEYHDDKAAFLKWISKVDVLIDDNPANINAARSIGINGILWPRPWNDSRVTLQEALVILKNILGNKMSTHEPFSHEA